MNGEVLPMRLFIQIPCLNEEKTLPLVLEHMPKEIPGIDDIQLLIIDDGCSDNTVEVARSLGVQHVVHHAKPMGLARAFRDGVDYALKHGADIVVNTDGDNQYPSSAIGELVQPSSVMRRISWSATADRENRRVLLVQEAYAGIRLLGGESGRRHAYPGMPPVVSGHIQRTPCSSSTSSPSSATAWKPSFRPATSVFRSRRTPSPPTRRPANPVCSRTSSSTWPSREARLSAAS